METYPASYIRQRTGITRRQLELWEKAGYFTPAEITGEGRGSRRGYDGENIADIETAMTFVRDGYTVPAAWEKVGRLKQRTHHQCDYLDRSLNRCISRPVGSILVKPGYAISLCSDHRALRVDRIEPTAIPDVVRVYQYDTFDNGGFFALLPEISPGVVYCIDGISAHMRAYVAKHEVDELTAGVVTHWADQLRGFMQEAQERF